jgi:hypothetical protein
MAHNPVVNWRLTDLSSWAWGNRDDRGPGAPLFFFREYRSWHGAFSPPVAFYSLWFVVRSILPAKHTPLFIYLSPPLFPRRFRAAAGPSKLIHCVCPGERQGSIFSPGRSAWLNGLSGKSKPNPTQSTHGRQPRPAELNTGRPWSPLAGLSPQQRFYPNRKSWAAYWSSSCPLIFFKCILCWNVSALTTTETLTRSQHPHLTVFFTKASGNGLEKLWWQVDLGIWETSWPNVGWVTDAGPVISVLSGYCLWNGDNTTS